MRRATPARLGLSCRRAGSPSGRPRSAAPSGSADSRPRGLRRSGGLAPHRAAPRVPAEARRPGPPRWPRHAAARTVDVGAPLPSGRSLLSPPPRRQDGRRRVGAAGLRRAPRGHQLAQPEPGRPAPAHGQRGRHGPALERRGRPVLRPAARYAPPWPPSRRPPRTPARSWRPRARAREGCCAGQGRRAELPAIGVSGPRGALCGGEDPLSARCVKSFPLQKF